MTGLKNGITTGACAAAAAKAAALLLATGRPAGRVEIPLPDGTRLAVPVAAAERTGAAATASVLKDAGDDPDVTNGCRVLAEVSWSEGPGVAFAAGPGVGTVTKPGLALAPGEPAINPGPRRMIAAALQEVTDRGVHVQISVPGGEDLARRTFNPRLGIAGGLSILGTTGIVRPFSCSALRETLRCSLAVLAAAGVEAPILVPGHIGARAAAALLGAPEGRVVEVGNEWGFALDAALGHPFRHLTLLGHPGKLAKLAQGVWDTHSQRSASALPLVAALQEELGGRAAAGATTVEGFFGALAPPWRRRLGDTLAERIRSAVTGRTQGRFAVRVNLIDLAGRLLGAAGETPP